jgi:hypothetical protein
MSKYRMWAGVLTVFFCGLVIGWLSNTLYHYHEAKSRFERIVRGGGTFLADITLERLSKELEITAEQQSRIRPLLIDGFREIDKFHRLQIPKLDQIIQEMADKLKEHLDPRQRQKMEQEGGWKMLRPSPPPPPPPQGGWKLPPPQGPHPPHMEPRGEWKIPPTDGPRPPRHENAKEGPARDGRPHQ